MHMYLLYYSHPVKCEIKVNADSDMRNKQTHHGNDRDGSKDVATVPATVSAAVAAATVLFAYAISISRQLQSPDACQTQCKPRRRSCHRSNLPLDSPLLCRCHILNAYWRQPTKRMRMRMRDSGHLYKTLRGNAFEIPNMSQQDQDQSKQRKLQLKMEMQMELKSRWSQSWLATKRWHCCCRIKHIYKMQIANTEYRRRTWKSLLHFHLWELQL